MKKKIGIIGTGSLGTALVYLVNKKNHQIYIYDVNQNNIDKLFQNKKIQRKENIIPLSSMSDVINKSQYLIPCLPSAIIDIFYQTLQPIYNQQKIISVSKGFYQNSQYTISQKVTPWLPPKNFVVFTGPTFSHEIINDEPTSAIIASKKLETAKEVQQLFSTKYFNPVITNHVLESEYGGILKNCYAICFGILHHASLGMNTKSLCLDKILQETKDFYQKNNLNGKDVYNISFLGDLIATSYNPKSRNFQFGNRLQHHQKITVEGELNIKPILLLANKTKTKLPILKKTHQIISNPNKIILQINDLKKILLS